VEIRIRKKLETEGFSLGSSSTSDWTSEKTVSVDVVIFDQDSEGVYIDTLKERLDAIWKIARGEEMLARIEGITSSGVMMVAFVL